MKTKKKTLISKENAKFAAPELIKIFGEKKENLNYSKGFQKWQKLSLKKIKALMLRNSFDYQKCLDELENQTVN
jgi:hypothetical protein